MLKPAGFLRDFYSRRTLLGIFGLAAMPGMTLPGDNSNGSPAPVDVLEHRPVDDSLITSRHSAQLTVRRHHRDGPLCPARYHEVAGGEREPWTFDTDNGRRRWALGADQAISPQMLGARGDGQINDTAAFQAAAAFIRKNGGGRLVVPEGVYMWGAQQFAERAGRGFAYRGDDLIQISHCIEPVIIEFQNCRIVSEKGQRFGSFDPITGQALETRIPFYGADQAAQIGCVIDVSDNKSVSILGKAELDGNIAGQQIGGSWGDTGRQLRHVGVVAYNNQSFVCENIHAHHFGLDGFVIGWRGLTDKHRIFPHVLRDCRATFNGRQGLSWVGGNSLTIERSEFSHTGKNGVVFSAPGAGIDIEAEDSICRDGHFRQVRCVDNMGVGLLADQGDSSGVTLEKCTFVGTTMWSVWALKPRFTFVGCQVVGAVAWLKGDVDAAQAARVVGGRWSMDSKDSPTGVIYGDKMDFGAAENVLFDGVVFTADGPRALPWSTPKARYSNCTFRQEGAATFYTRGVFLGRCTFVAPKGRFDYNYSTVVGRLTLNGKDVVL